MEVIVNLVRAESAPRVIAIAGKAGVLLQSLVPDPTSPAARILVGMVAVERGEQFVERMRALAEVDSASLKPGGEAPGDGASR